MRKQLLNVFVVCTAVSACSLQSDVDNPTALEIKTASIANGVLTVNGTGFSNLKSMSMSQNSGGTSSVSLSNVSATSFSATLPSVLNFPASLLMETAHAETQQPLSTLSTLTMSGKLGVGTLDPLGTFEVSNSDAESFDVSPGTGTILVTSTNRSLSQYIGLDVYFSQMRFRPSGGAVTGITIDPSGNMGIGTTAPNYQLELSTDSAGKPGTSTWTIASDERLKDIRGPFTRGLDAIRALTTIYFRYKRDNPLNLPSEKEYVGIRAQDVQKVIPEAVSIDKLGYLHVTNDAIIWTAINAIQDLEKENSDLKQRLERQQHDLDAIKGKLGL